MISKLLAAVFFVSVPCLCFSETASDEEEKAIRSLIEDLVFSHEKAKGIVVFSPRMGGDFDDDYKRGFERCQRAFKRLREYEGKALPILAEHLDDKRPSINFRNHMLGRTVGDACYWNLHFQLQDRPENYSEYGYVRKGRDGKRHVKPYWEGSPFDEAGGISKWLEANRGLGYAEMQIKCLQWLLELEREIGAADAESYFLNILPLEIRILERRLQLGADVEAGLKRLRDVLEKRDVSAVPEALLPGVDEFGRKPLRSSGRE